MSPFAQTSFIAHQSPIVRSHSARVWISTHTTLLNITTLAVLVTVCLAYVVQVNGTASKGYAIRDLETKIHQLAVSNQQLETETQEAQSLQNITHAVKMIGMVKAEQPVYLDASGASYAFAR